MSRRALVIGSEIAGLQGVERDLDIVESLFRDRGFEVRRHEKGTATRDAIGAALADLAADTAEDDAVAVYYCGHGGRAEDVGPATGGVPQVLQFIAPYDYERSTPEDFRGITAMELSAHVAALTARTRNVSVLLDCCYSSWMARGRNLVPRSLPHTDYVDIAAHLDRLGVDRLARALSPNVEGNPDAVRLVAAGPAQQAFEYPGPGGVYVGLFTESLGRLLGAAGDAELTWAALARAVREWVQTVAPGQRPEAEGPAHRLLFTTDVDDRPGVLAVETVADGAVLAGGRIAGVGPGDVYTALDSARRDRPLGRLTVRSVTALSALADLQLAAGVPALPAGAQAHPVSRAGRRLAVTVEGRGRAAAAVRAGMAASRHIEPVDGAVNGQPVLAAVTVSDAGATVRDAAGPVTGPERNVEVLVRNLDRLARAASVRMAEPGDDEIRAALGVEWGLVADGAALALPHTGATVHVGDGVWVRLRNTGPPRIFVSVFSIGGGGRIGLVTNSDPSGRAMDREEEWVVGLRPEHGVVTGLPVSWPAGVPDALPRPESLLVVATSRRQELLGLQQEGVSRSAPESAVEQFLARIVDRGRRDIGPAGDPAVRFATRHIDFWLDPSPRIPVVRVSRTTG